MPSLKPGTHNLKLVVDTKTPFGSLTAERKVTIEDPAIGKLAEGYISARDSGDTKKASALREKLLAARYNRTIAPGKWFAIDKPTGTTSAKPARFSAKVKWFPEKDRLRAVVEVVDSNYTAPGDEEERKYRAYVDIFVCPSGADDDIYRVHVLQGDKPNEPYIAAIRSGEAGTQGAECPVKGTWKRTAGGYTAEVRIPWSALAGYQPGWKVMPVEAQVLQQGRWVVVLRDEQTRRAGHIREIIRDTDLEMMPIAEKLGNLTCVKESRRLLAYNKL